MFRTHLLVAATIALGLTASGRAIAQTFPAQSYPDRPIRLIVPFPPGGPTDYVARLVAQHVSANFGQVVLDNRPGAGGTIASKAVANADPDGYTLLYGSSATLGIAPALQERRIRSHQELRAGGAGLARSVRARRRSGGTGEYVERIHRLRQGQSREVEFRGDHRNATASGGR